VSQLRRGAAALACIAVVPPVLAAAVEPLPTTASAAIGPAMTGPTTPVPGSSKPRLFLPAGTQIPMKTIGGLSSRTNREGDRFELFVSEDVTVGGFTVIPRGSRGIGEISRVVTKGAFGKSGELGVQLLYVDIGDGHIRLDGKVGQRGKSGTGATVVTAILVGTLSFLVTGSSATLPAGTEMIGYVDRDLPIELKPAPSSTTAPTQGLRSH